MRALRLGLALLALPAAAASAQMMMMNTGGNRPSVSPAVWTMKPDGTDPPQVTALEKVSGTNAP